METMLGRFQADLGNVSGEIRSLQARACLCVLLLCGKLPDRPQANLSDVSGDCVRSLQAQACCPTCCQLASSAVSSAAQI